MKKTYVKPIMEMEGFVPNEYVAACWELTCKVSSCGYNKRIGGDGYSANDLEKFVNDYNQSNVIHAGNNSEYYHGGGGLLDFYKEDPAEYYHVKVVLGMEFHHELTITPVSKSDPHPNASN